jgi:hypothetical protein
VTSAALSTSHLCHHSIKGKTQEKRLEQIIAANYEGNKKVGGNNPAVLKVCH